MKVNVYFNLTRRCWSVKHKGRVVAHARRLLLSDCTFKVNEKGRQRVIRERQKHVHAYVRGTLEWIDPITIRGAVRELEELSSIPHPDIPSCDEGVNFSYNPYKCSTFYIMGTFSPVYTANLVGFGENSTWAWDINRVNSDQ